MYVISKIFNSPGNYFILKWHYLKAQEIRGQVSRSAVPGSPTLFYNEAIQVREFSLVNLSG